MIEDIMFQINRNIETKSVAKQYLATSYYERKIEQYIKFYNIILFGSSESGRRLFFMLNKERSQAIQAYCDNDKSRQGVFMDGIPILSPNEAVEKYPNALFIITSILYADEIIGQLISLGIQIEHISLFDIYRSGIGE